MYPTNFPRQEPGGREPLGRKSAGKSGGRRAGGGHGDRSAEIDPSHAHFGHGAPQSVV